MSAAATPLRFTVETLFPDLVVGWTHEALLGRAARRGLVDVRVNDLRRFANTPTDRVDDAPYGGGAGMVIRVDVGANAIDEARSQEPPADEVILLSPAGEPLTQRLVERFAGYRHLALLCGRYEGFDARTEGLVDREVSVGDFVLMGGELPALCLIEATVRLLPGALGDEESHRQDSFTTGLLDYPEYTRPPTFRGVDAPEILRSGHHAHIVAWRRAQALARTRARRPDLLASAELTPSERRELEAAPDTPPASDDA
ncbi:tRNA (guanosine(37)-N1)-methyltransferase TrmD [soil metagenome]